MSGTPFPPSRLKERFSLAYINAVAARAGFEVLETQVDIDGIDGLIRSTVGRRPQIDFQAKSTSQNVLLDDKLVFPLSRKNYDELRAETVNPRILIVVLLPEKESDWLLVEESGLLMRRCGYWISLRDAPASENTTTVTINLPRTQMFSETQLTTLMSRAQIG